MKKITAALSLLVTVAACSTDQAPLPSSSGHLLPPKIALDVQTISLADRSGLQPTYSPYNNNHFVPTIDDAIKQWASDRVQATGQNGQAIIIIKDASLTSQALPLEGGIENWFTRQQAIKYIGHADVSFEANGAEGFATADAAATRSVTLPEDPTPLERQNAYYTLLNGLMKDLGENLEAAIQAHMGNFIVTTPLYGTTAAPMGVLPSSTTIETSPLRAAAPIAQTPTTDSIVTQEAIPAPGAATHGQVVIPLSGGGYGQ